MRCDLCGVEGEHDCIYRESCPECGDKPFQGQIDCFICMGARYCIKTMTEEDKKVSALLRYIGGLNS
jgi:hypothetical protein